MPKSKKKVAADKSKLSQDKVEAFEVDEDSMSKSKDGEPTQPATYTVKEDGASDEDHGPVKQHYAEETKKKRCTNNDNDDDDNNKSASKKNDDKSLCDNASTVKTEDEGSTSTKEVADETTTDCCSPKNTTDTSPKKKKNGDDVADKKCANNKEVTDEKQQKKKIDNSSQSKSSSGKEQSTKNDCCAKTSTSAASRTSSNPTKTKSNNTTSSSSNVTISTTTVVGQQTHAQQSSQPTHYNTRSSASAAVAQQQQQQQSKTTTTQYTSLSDLDDNDGYSDANDTLLTMSFNQDGGCLAVGTGSGFRICNVHPFEENLRRTLGGDDNNGGGGNTTNDGVVGGGGGGGGNGGGIAQIEMLYRTNLLAITGSSSSSSRQFPPNKVLMYDDHYQRTIGELIFRQRVLTTRLRRDRIIVVLRDRTYIYNFADMTLLDKIYTGDNPLGLIGISLDNGGVGGSTTVAEDASGRSSSQQQQQQRNNGMVLAFPSKQQGQVRVELYGLRRSTVVNAHESSLGALALSIDGSLLATASERGTVIRLFDTRGVTIGGGGGGSGISSTSRQQGTATTASSVSSSVPLREFRRGVDRATISCLTFSLDSNWLGCASDHGTVHIFQTYDPNNNNLSDTKKKKTRSSSMTGKAIRMLPKLVTAPKKYIGMDGVHSYAQVRGVPHPHACAFVPDREQTIAVAGMDEYGNGCLLLAEFGSKSNTTSGGGGVGSNGDDSGIGENNNMDDTEARRVGYHRFFKSKSPSSQIGSSRRRTKSKDCKIADDTLVEGGAYIDDTPIDLRMDHISIGDENEDHFVPIDYNMRK